MEKKLIIPEKTKRTENFTVRLSPEERAELEFFCEIKKTTISELIRFSLKAVMERAK